MKKQIKIILLSIILILVGTLTVKAADATATLSLDNSEVEKGDTFTVTLNVSCEEGINGLEGTVSYDEEKLELESIDVGDTTNWSNLGEGLDFAILHAKSGTITSADILKITFKVKDTVTVGTTANVTLSNIVLDSDAASNSSKEIGTKEIEVTIIEESEQENVTLTGIRIKSDPVKVAYKVGENFDKTGLVVEAQYSDGTTKEVTNYTYAPTGELELTDTRITVTYTEDGVTKTAVQTITVIEANEPDGNDPEENDPEEKEPEESEPNDNEQESTKEPDDTQANKPIVNTGLDNYALIAIAAIVGVAIISYKKYREYKNI